MRRQLFACLFLPVLLQPVSAGAANLVTNGSFEESPLAQGAYRDMLVGSADLPGWTIVGVAGTHISQVEGAYPGNPGYSFPAQDGHQWVDLAGYSDNAADGVRQTVATTIGQLYDFSFWLGNVSGGFFGVDSLVNVSFSSGGTDFSCVNAIETTTLTWLKCSQSFVAQSDTTTFTISNGDPRTDYSSAIDNIVLGAAGGVPEPEVWAMLIAGFAVVGGARRRQNASRVKTRVTPRRARSA